MSNIIDGKKLAQTIRDDLAKKVASLKEKNIVPGIAVILVGNDDASTIYVRNKRKACAKTGIESFSYDLHSNTSHEKIVELIGQLNKNPKVHGILVQLPLPSQINEELIIEAIDPKKDVDGFHPVNMGKLLIGLKGFRPSTPLGILALIDSINYNLKGKHAVILGRSRIVGKPAALMLLERHATVTICHSRTKNLDEIVRSADVLIAAIGSPKIVKGDWVKKGAVVIDVGINRLDDGSLIGDVEFETAAKNASAITPVPGGVGPMTIAMLLKNTVEAAMIS